MSTNLDTADHNPCAAGVQPPPETSVYPPRIAHQPRRVPRPGALCPRSYADWMLDLDTIDVDQIAMALADQTDYEQGSLNGKRAFRRFRAELHDNHPELISVWHSLREARERARAVRWLAEQGLIADGAARQFENDHPEPALP